MPLLEIDHVTVRFGGLTAVDETDLDADTGTVTGLIGPNGAGKTTLFNVITGLQAPTAGEVRMDGRVITRMRTHRRTRLGIARTFQRLEAFGSLSARDNILVASEMRRRWWKERFDPRAVADDLLERIGIAEVADEPVDALPTGTARLVELARALATAPRMLLLDEPSSGLNDDESANMGRLLVSLTRETDLGVLLVEHDMSFVMGVCDYINVLDFGNVIARGTPDQIQQDPAVQEAYLGSGAAS